MDRGSTCPQRIGRCPRSAGGNAAVAFLSANAVSKEASNLCLGPTFVPLGERIVGGGRHQRMFGSLSGTQAPLPRTPPYPSRQAARSSGLRRVDGVGPGIRPRLAMGRPSISLMSPVKSIGAAPLMYDPTANESTGAPASWK